jgi:glycosyltransferase involved in cell wall biosynthesis
VLTNSLIICTKDRLDDLRRTIESIRSQSLRPNELIIVDATVGDETARFIKELEDEIEFTLRYYHSTPGLTLQRNAGIKYAKGDLIHFLDDDVDLENDYLKSICEVFANDSSKNIGGAGGLLTNITPSNSFAALFRRIFFLVRVDGEGKMQKSGFPAFQWVKNRSRISETEILCGLCCYRRNIFDSFSFDEGLSQYGLMEDVDFSFRVSKVHKLIYTPFARVFHRETPKDRIGIGRYFDMKMYNHFYLYRKNIPISPWTLFLFLWSNVGVFFRALIVSLKKKSLFPIIGLLRGSARILSDCIGARKG